MQAKNILIFTAVRMETRCVQQALRYLDCRVHAVGLGGWHLPKPLVVADSSLILMCGLAGGLDPSLKVGDVVLDDPTGLLPANILHRRGKIHSVEQVVSDPAEKAALFKQTEALAVDMEQATVRTFAADFGIPVVGIRAISDTAQQMLDPVVLRLIDKRGYPKPASIVKNLICRPSLIPYLRELNKNTNIALRELAIAAMVVVTQLERI